MTIQMENGEIRGYKTTLRGVEGTHCRNGNCHPIEAEDADGLESQIALIDATYAESN